MHHKIIAFTTSSVADTKPITDASIMLDAHWDQGWELVSSHAANDSNSTTIVHVFVLRMRPEPREDITTAEITREVIQQIVDRGVPPGYEPRPGPGSNHQQKGKRR